MGKAVVLSTRRPQTSMRAALAAAFAGLLCCAPLGCSAGAFTPGFMQGAKPEGSLEGDVAVLTVRAF